jgi:antitoxin component of MazEF toxin-antitoxin module
MLLQKIFGAGNSDVVAIPKGLMKELGLVRGQKVIVDKADEAGAIIIRKSTKDRKTPRKGSVNSKEFKKWLDVFLRENAEILDELATR